MSDNCSIDTSETCTDNTGSGKHNFSQSLPPAPSIENLTNVEHISNSNNEISSSCPGNTCSHKDSSSLSLSPVPGLEVESNTEHQCSNNTINKLLDSNNDTTMEIGTDDVETPHLDNMEEPSSDIYIINSRVQTSATVQKPDEDIPKSGLYFIDKASRKNPYLEVFSEDSESDSESSSESSEVTSSSESSSDSDQEEPAQKKKVPDKQNKPQPLCNHKTKGELSVEDLPPIEDLKITVPEEDIHKIGHVRSIVGTQVVIESFLNERPLDLDSVLFLSNGNSFGKVFDVFGQVVCPLYSVRFNSKEDIEALEVKIGDPIFSAPTHTDVTIFVFTEDLKKEKGTDASWKDNNEPPVECREFSDDEEERLFKQKLRAKHKNTGSTDTSSTPTRKPRVHENNGLPPKHFLRPQRFQMRSNNGFPSRPNQRPQWNQCTPQNPSFNRVPQFPNQFQFRGPPPNFNPHTNPSGNSFFQPPPNSNMSESQPPFKPPFSFECNGNPLPHISVQTNGCPPQPNMQPPPPPPPPPPPNNCNTSQTSPNSQHPPSQFNPLIPPPGFTNIQQNNGSCGNLFTPERSSPTPNWSSNNQVSPPQLNRIQQNNLRPDNPQFSPNMVPYQPPEPYFQQFSSSQPNQFGPPSLIRPNQNHLFNTQFGHFPNQPAFPNVHPVFGGSPVFSNNSQTWNQTQNIGLYQPPAFVNSTPHRPPLLQTPNQNQ